MKRSLFLLMLLCAPALAHATCGPEVVLDLTLTNGRFGVCFNWSAPYANCSSGGGVTEYSVRISTSPITEQNFWSATPITNAPFSGASPGTQECGDALSLSQGTHYYVALKAKDSSGNWSPLSNVLSFTTNTNGPSCACG